MDVQRLFTDSVTNSFILPDLFCFLLLISLMFCRSWSTLSCLCVWNVPLDLITLYTRNQLAARGPWGHREAVWRLISDHIYWPVAAVLKWWSDGWWENICASRQAAAAPRQRKPRLFSTSALWKASSKNKIACWTWALGWRLFIILASHSNEL